MNMEHEALKIDKRNLLLSLKKCESGNYWEKWDLGTQAFSKEN